MSEYWVSHKKYYCTYCKIYISDDAPSKQQHENGLRHKGNKERFVRNLYKTSEKKKHDQEEERREIARIDQAAQAAFAQDVGSGLAKSSSSSRPPPPIASTSAAKPQPTASSPWANYSTAASLGYTDPDAERLAAEAERKRTQGVAGEWEVVDTPKSGQSTASGTRKREHEWQAQVDEEEDTRHFKLRKKTAKGLGENWDPESIAIKLKPKKEEPEESPVVKEEVEQVAEPAVPLPKWTSRGWKRPGEDEVPNASEAEQPDAVIEPSIAPELEVDPKVSPQPKDEPPEAKVPPVKSEEAAPEPAPDAPVFRKRKVAPPGRGRR